MRALELLVQTVPHVWKTNNDYGLSTDVVISQDHANLWPDEGNLLALPGMNVVDEVDVKGRVLEPQEPQDSDSDSGALGNDGDDGGPAPLQTVQPPDVEFEGSLYVGGRMSSCYANASAALHQLKKTADRLRVNGNAANGNEGDNVTSSDGILSPGGTTATYHQENVLPTGDFVNMDTTLYSWSLAFPTIFPPCYVDKKWVILGDYTGWHTTHNRFVKNSEWYQWLAWRSDGRPMRHPTFCLMLYSHKRRTALQGQGRVALHTNNINTTITAEEFLSEWDNGDLQHKLKEG